MPLFGILLGLSAAATWAVASLVAHRPVRHFGTFSFVQIQLPTSALLLALVVTVLGTWNTVSFDHVSAIVVSGFVGILLGDLFLHRCLELGGPRRMQVLFALNAPLAAMLGFFFLGETLPPAHAFGGALMLVGVIMAIVFVRSDDKENILEQVDGSLAMVVFWGLGAALCQAIGLVTVKPAIDGGADPLAVSAYRTAGSAVLIMAMGAFPMWRYQKVDAKNIGVFVQCVLAGWMGYVLAMSLLLVALRYYNSGVVAIMGSTVPVMLLPIMWIKTGKRPPLAAWVGAALVVAGSAVIIL